MRERERERDPQTDENEISDSLNIIDELSSQSFETNESESSPLLH